MRVLRAGNEGGDPGDNRRQLGIPDVIMEEVHQGPGLKEKGTPTSERYCWRRPTTDDWRAD
ncbi:hypothetical protein LNP74_30995 [Klebsiella pneumoniae subsp. pneumoniae]|nr:hypothetical protein [Klebsiella pneumoniae subsp. pneumoniae]